ncbi:hypothetical protein ABE288_24280 [Bacillus salipaludis]
MAKLVIMYEKPKEPEKFELFLITTLEFENMEKLQEAFASSEAKGEEKRW